MVAKILQNKVNEVVRILTSEKILPEEQQLDDDADDLVAQALMHSSAIEQHKGKGFPEKSNETLEWYGDKVINILLRTAILRFFPQNEVERFTANDRNNPAGELYNAMKSNVNLLSIATRLALDKSLLVADNVSVTDKMKANVVEAIIGALMHSRTNISWAMLVSVFFPEITKRINSYSNVKPINLSENEEYLHGTLMVALQKDGSMAKSHREKAEREERRLPNLFYSDNSVWPSDVNRVINESTLLLEAVEHNYPKIIEQLLKRNVDILQTDKIIREDYDEGTNQKWDNFLKTQDSPDKYNGFLKQSSTYKHLIIDFPEAIRNAIKDAYNERGINQLHLFNLGVDVYKWAIADILLSYCQDEATESDLENFVKALFSVKDISSLADSLGVSDNLVINKILSDNSHKVNVALIVLGALFISNKWYVTEKRYHNFTINSNPDSDVKRFDYIISMVDEAVKSSLLLEIEKWRKAKQQPAQTAQAQNIQSPVPRSNNNLVPSAPTPQTSNTAKTAEQPAITLYFQAALAKKLTDCEQWIQQAKRISSSDIDVYAQRGDTPLIHAIKAKKEDNAIALLNAGANPTLSHKKTGKMPLQYAQEHELTNLINRLTENAPRSSAASSSARPN